MVANFFFLAWTKKNSSPTSFNYFYKKVQIHFITIEYGWPDIPRSNYCPS